MLIMSFNLVYLKLINRTRLLYRGDEGFVFN